jgi:hypothetical protein
MGMWRTIQVEGKITGRSNIDTIIDYLTVDKRTYDSKAYEEDEIFYLQFGNGVYGINQWIKSDSSIDAVGNVYERDCTIDDLFNELSKLAKKFPTLDMYLHAGDDYESRTCVCSFIIKDGEVSKVEPLINELNEISDEQAMKNFISQLRG